MTEDPELFLRRALRLDLEIEPSSRLIQRVGALRNADGERKAFSRRAEPRKSIDPVAG